MVEWHQWLNGYDFEQAPGVSDGQGSLVCSKSMCHKESDMSDWTELKEKGQEPSHNMCDHSSERTTMQNQQLWNCMKMKGIKDKIEMKRMKNYKAHNQTNKAGQKIYNC